MDQELDNLFKQSKAAPLCPIAATTLAPKLTTTVDQPETSNQLPSPPSHHPANQPPECPKLSRRQKRVTFTDDVARTSRTLFIGNLPVACCQSKSLQKELKRKFSTHGAVESIRFRSVGISKPLPKKVAIITGQLHKDRSSVNGYVVMDSVASARAALVENASVFHSHHIRVDIATTRSSGEKDKKTEGKGNGEISRGETNSSEKSTDEKKHDTKRSIFIGNLPLAIQDEQVWECFGSCGPITNVRVIRDKTTNLGKGFGYVAFANKSSVDLAVMLSGTDCGGRPLRVQKCAKEGYQKRKADYIALRKAQQTDTTAKNLADAGATKAKAVDNSKKAAKRTSNFASTPAVKRQAKGTKLSVKKRVDDQ